jgi:hypothetical protein
VKSAWKLFPVVLALFVLAATLTAATPAVAVPALAVPQSRIGFPTPPEPLDPKPADKAQATPTRHLDLDRLQREADELSRSAQTIPSDIASIRKGMLPKDVIEKLKQIEKLSKHLRAELNP